MMASAYQRGAEGVAARVKRSAFHAPSRAVKHQAAPLAASSGGRRRDAGNGARQAAKS